MRKHAMEVKMANYKIVIGNKDGKTVQKELGEDFSNSLVGKVIGDKVSGDEIGFEGYEFEITGGSDNSGSPMRKDVKGVGKSKVLCVEGTGVHKKRHGQKQRKTVCGNTLNDKISQVNLKVLKAGKTPLIEKPAEGAGDEKTAENAAEQKGAPAEAKKE